MKTFIVMRDNNLNIKFTGEEISSASSTASNACSNYSGCVGEWTKLTLYRTKSGKYICERIDYTQWEGAHTRYDGCVCETIDQVIKFFGHGWLAKDLYDDANIDAVVEIE